MEIRSLGFRTDLALLGLGGSVIEDRGDCLVIRTSENPGYHWGNFVLLHELPGPADVARAVAQFEDAFPGSDYRAIGVDTCDRLPDGDAMGLALEVNSVLTASTVRPPRHCNTEATYRRLASDEDWAQLADLEARCFDTAGSMAFREFLSRRVVGFRRWCEAGHGAWWGAFVDGALGAGMGLFRAGDGLARFQNVVTRPEFRQRGLAGTLAYDVACWGLRELGVSRLVIVADPGAAAIRIYRSLGFTEAEPMVQLYRPPRA